ncbi:hypothetical protein HY637_03265 [Candidatus Woesearchaeota archaeon]|nr:hypothetical protein [Candidatus Woesearchaeota archaeon]
MVRKKRGEVSSEVLYFIPKIIFLIAVLFAVVILVKKFIIITTDIRPVESHILVRRLLYSKEGISYFDSQLNRVYPGTIDLERFKMLSRSNPNELDMSIINYGEDNPIISAKMTLKQQGKEDIIAYYNKDRFDKWEPRILPGVKGGAGSVRAFKEKQYVMIKDSNKLSNGTLEFYMVS